MNIKELRSKTGLTQKAFAAKYDIPVRTLQDWESEAHKAPNYVIDLLSKAVATDSIIPMAWIFWEYRDKAGTGSHKVFRNKAEAINYAQSEWGRLNGHDQQSYKDDPAGEFFVALVPMEWDDVALEYVPDMSSYTPEWSAF